MTECMRTTTICLWEIRSGDEKRTWKITGLVALSDYSCLFQNNNDSMFDAVKFGVSVVTEEDCSIYGAGKTAVQLFLDL